MGVGHVGLFFELDGERYYFLVGLPRRRGEEIMLTRDTVSYLAPILRSVGISEPIKITLINSGLGEFIAYRAIAVPSLIQNPQPYGTFSSRPPRLSTSIASGVDHCS